MGYRILIVGEILFDVYPQYKRLGGAPFNFSYHLHRFGHEIAFVSRIGDDDNGHEIASTLRQRQFPNDHIQIDHTHPTGTVLVELDDRGLPDFTIVDQVAYDFIETNEVKALFEDPVDLIYFGTLAQRQHNSRNAILDILQMRQDQTLIFYDMNLRQSFYDQAMLRQSLDACNIAKLNEDELKTVAQLFEFGKNEESVSRNLRQRFNIDYLCITKGERGSAIYFGSDKPAENAAPADTIVVDTVGAGDAYSAVLAHGILNGHAPSQIVGEAHRFALAMCGISGAIPDNEQFYRENMPRFD